MHLSRRYKVEPRIVQDEPVVEQQPNKLTVEELYEVLREDFKDAGRYLFILKQELQIINNWSLSHRDERND